MTCAELDQRAVDYLYGELSAADRAVVDAHLGGCDDCRRELRALERALGVTREALRGPLAHEAPSRVRVALEQEAARVAAQAAARRPHEGGGLWDWLRRPWFLPAVASFAVVTIFVLAKPAIVDKPRQAMQQAEEEARSRGEEPEAVPVAPEPAMAPVPAAAPPAEPESERSAPALGAAKERSAEKKVSSPGPRGVAGIRGSGDGVVDEERARRADTPARRSTAAASRTGSRWATPPPTAPRPAAASRPAAAPPPPLPAAPVAVADEPMAAPAAKPRDDDMARERAAPGTASGEGRSIGRMADTAASEGKGAAPAKSKARANASAPAPQAPGGPARAPAAPSAGAAAPPPPAPAPAEAEVTSAQAPATKSESEEADTASDGARELPFPELRRRADLAFQQGRWERAMRDYRELLRRFGGHADAPLWRRRLEISTQSAGR